MILWVLVVFSPVFPVVNTASSVLKAVVVLVRDGRILPKRLPGSMLYWGAHVPVVFLLPVVLVVPAVLVGAVVMVEVVEVI